MGTNYDLDPDALAWARAKVERLINRFADFERQCTEKGDTDRAKAWKRAAWDVRRGLIGGEGCVIGAFDERLPALASAIDHAIPAPIDRAIRRDHSLCGAEPCSDCR